MHLIDTHAHLLNRYYKKEDIPKVIDDSIRNNVKRIINISIDENSIIEVIKSTELYKEVFCAIGFHPQDIKKDSISKLSIIEDNIKKPKVVAVGEIGFDFYRKDNPKLRKIQEEVFHKQLLLAKKCKLPVIIHSRNATNETMRVLKQYPEVKKVVHCFSENKNVLKEYLNIKNTFVSFTGIVTFKNTKEVHEAFIDCPDDKYMLETDCPYLAPTPYRGKDNEPKHVLEIAKFCAQLKEQDINEVVKNSSNNAYSFFKKLY